MWRGQTCTGFEGLNLWLMECWVYGPTKRRMGNRFIPMTRLGLFINFRIIIMAAQLPLKCIIHTRKKERSEMLALKCKLRINSHGQSKFEPNPDTSISNLTPPNSLRHGTSTNSLFSSSFAPSTSE